jgi:hypothetical protein
MSENKGGRRPKYTDPSLFENKVNGYFDKCDENKEPYTITGLALFLDFCDRQSLIDYANRNKFEDEITSARFAFAIKKAKMRIENFYIKRVFSQNASGSMFLLKTLFHYREKDKADDNAISVYLKFDKTDKKL